MTHIERLALLRERGAQERALRRFRRSDPERPPRLCACGCGAVLERGYLSSYLPDHRDTAVSAHSLCLCGCGAEIPEGRRYRYMPGHR